MFLAAFFLVVFIFTWFHSQLLKDDYALRDIRPRFTGSYGGDSSDSYGGPYGGPELTCLCLSTAIKCLSNGDVTDTYGCVIPERKCVVESAISSLPPASRVTNQCESNVAPDSDCLCVKCEVCDNNIDDDGDGKKDCLDEDCVGTTDCNSLNKPQIIEYIEMYCSSLRGPASFTDFPGKFYSTNVGVPPPTVSYATVSGCGVAYVDMEPQRHIIIDNPFHVPVCSDPCVTALHEMNHVYQSYLPGIDPNDDSSCEAREWHITIYSSDLTKCNNRQTAMEANKDPYCNVGGPNLYCGNMLPDLTNRCNLYTKDCPFSNLVKISCQTHNITLPPGATWPTG